MTDNEEYKLDQAAFNLWLMGEVEDNHAELNKVKQILPIVINECCTTVQKTYITHYFVNGMSIPQIAKVYGLNPSTVSKTIHRGLTRAYKYLRFSSPLFYQAVQHKGYLTRNGGKSTKKRMVTPNELWEN